MKGIVYILLVIGSAYPSASYNAPSNASAATASSAQLPENSTANSSAQLPENSTGNSSAAQIWLAADRALRKASAIAVKSILPHALKASESLNLTSGCSREMFKFLIGIRQTKLWAFRMLDSFGKIPNGVLSGNINSLGDYDQCINTDIPGGPSRGQYCTVDVAPPLPPRVRFVPFHVPIPEFVNITPWDSVTTEMFKLARSFYHLRLRTAVCVPSSCNRNDVERIANKVLELMKLEFQVFIPNCESKVDQLIFNSHEIIVIAVLSALLLLAILATVMDICYSSRLNDAAWEENISFPSKCLLCFSLIRNLRRLLKKDDSRDSIKIFHGLKVCAIMGVILCHTYVFVNYQAMSGLLEVKSIISDPLFQVVANGAHGVQIFFYISAVLSAYGVMRMKRNLNIFMFIFRRIWRLAPPFMLVIGCVFLIPHLGSGPVWKETVVDRLTEKCKQYWWANLIFVNNYVPLKNMCLIWTWYIPVDMQLYILSLAVLIPLRRNPRWGLMMNSALFFTGVIVTAVFHIYYNLPPTLITVFDHPDDIAYATDYGYHRTYVYAGSYCVGLTVGYVLATKKEFRIPVFVHVLGWIVTITVSLAILFGAYDWNQGNLPSSLVSTVYGTTSKFALSLVFAWITLSCLANKRGILASLLSWEVLVPLGRLTYITYLIHPIVMLMYVGSTRTLIRQEHRTMVFQYLANIMMSYMVALPLSLLFESPFMALENLFTKRVRNDDYKTDNNDMRKAGQNHNSHLRNNSVAENNRSFVIGVKEIKLDESTHF